IVDVLLTRPGRRLTLAQPAGEGRTLVPGKPVPLCPIGADGVSVGAGLGAGRAVARGYAGAVGCTRTEPRLDVVHDTIPHDVHIDPPIREAEGRFGPLAGCSRALPRTVISSIPRPWPPKGARDDLKRPGRVD